MTLEKKLVRLRKKEGMSQADVSEKLNNNWSICDASFPAGNCLQ